MDYFKSSGGFPGDRCVFLQWEKTMDQVIDVEGEVVGFLDACEQVRFNGFVGGKAG